MHWIFPPLPERLNVLRERAARLVPFCGVGGALAATLLGGVGGSRLLGAAWGAVGRLRAGDHPGTALAVCFHSLCTPRHL